MGFKKLNMSHRFENKHTIQLSQTNSKLTGTHFYFKFTEFIDFTHNKGQGGKLISDKWNISKLVKVC